MATGSPNASIGSRRQRSVAGGVGILTAAQHLYAASGEARDGRGCPCANRSAARAGLQQTSEARSKEAACPWGSCCVTQGVHANTVIGVALAEIAEIPLCSPPLW